MKIKTKIVKTPLFFKTNGRKAYEYDITSLLILDTIQCNNDESMNPLETSWHMFN